MTLEAELRAFLLADAMIASLVGTGSGFAGVYPAPAPQGAPSPFVTFQRITADRVYSIYGPSGLAGPLIQIDCWSEAPEHGGTYGETKDLAEAVRRRLDGYRGAMGSVTVQEVTIETESDLYEPQDKTRRVSFDFRIWFEET